MRNQTNGKRGKPKKGRARSVAGKAVLCCAAACCLFLSGCHVFPWYVPKEYSDGQKEEIYAFIRDELLAKRENYIAHVTYADPDDRSERTANIWSCNGKLIMNFDLWSEDHDSAVYYDGEYRSWDEANGRETVRAADPEEWKFLFDGIERHAEYYKTVVGTDDLYDGYESYFREFWPWGYGMAQMCYAADGDFFGGENLGVSATWTVQNGSPLVPNAEFGLINENKTAIEFEVGLQLYAEPYDIEERIESVLSSYEQTKTPAGETDD